MQATLSPLSSSQAYKPCTMAAGRQAGHHPGVSRSACLVRQAGRQLAARTSARPCSAAASRSPCRRASRWLSRSLSSCSRLLACPTRCCALCTPQGTGDRAQTRCASRLVSWPPLVWLHTTQQPRFPAPTLARCLPAAAGADSLPPTCTACLQPSLLYMYGLIGSGSPAPTAPCRQHKQAWLQLVWL